MDMGNEIWEPLRITIAETLRAYDTAQRKEWQAGTLLDSLLPEVERPRTANKYKIQCKDHHYGEVLAMNDLQADGWSWFYENFYLFPHRYANRWLDHCKWIETSKGHAYPPGTRELIHLLGRDVMQRLWKAAEIYSPVGNSNEKAKEPDLLAYREREGRIEIRAVEVKLAGDRLTKRGQLLGLAILQKVLGCEIVIIDYQAEPHLQSPRSHDEVFEPI